MHNRILHDTFDTSSASTGAADVWAHFSLRAASAPRNPPQRGGLNFQPKLRTTLLAAARIRGRGDREWKGRLSKARKPALSASASASATPPDVGTTIHQLRRAQGMSLDQVTAQSGVSKSMLSKIERNRTNPTLGTVWRLAAAFGVGVEEIIGRGRRDNEIKHVRQFETPTLKSADGGCTVRILGPIDLAGSVEWYELLAGPNSALVSEPHENGAVEHLTVLSGQLLVESGGRKIEAGVGDTVRYSADVRHAIRNLHKKAARAFIVVTHRRPPPVNS